MNLDNDIARHLRYTLLKSHDAYFLRSIETFRGVGCVDGYGYLNYWDCNGNYGIVLSCIV